MNEAQVWAVIVLGTYVALRTVKAMFLVSLAKQALAAAQNQEELDEVYSSYVESMN